MCGIAGFFGHGNPDHVTDMLGALFHRGPDDGHMVTGPGFTLGARRLSIIDVADGRQPVADEGGHTWVAQNGEIYNFVEVRDRLQRQGHRFRTRCDTEVIAHVYAEHGADTPRHLDGMFAIAMYDRQSQQGYLIRDRLGKKPLYYTEVDGSLYFASEIKALLTRPGFDRSIDWVAVHHFFSYKHVPSPMSVYQRIRALPPACILHWQNGHIEVQRYWHPSHQPTETGADEADQVETLLSLLERGVARRLMSDVPVGFFLSGGLDSSLSTCIAARLSHQPIQTFTLGYAEDSTTPGKTQDSVAARRLATLYGTEHREEVIDFRTFRDDFTSIIGQFDEPFSAVVSTWFLARLIGRHVKVALAGDGADELFGSYLSHRLAAALDQYRPGVDSPDFEGRAGYLDQVRGRPDWEWRYSQLVLSDTDKRQLYSAHLNDLTRDVSTMDHFRGYFRGLTATDHLNRMLEAELYSFFPDQVLAFVDRLSMAHSLEVRSAFLDTALVEYAVALPGSLKIRGRETKYLLKKAALRYLPEDIVYRPKEGFVMPINTWLLNQCADMVRNQLQPDRVRMQGLFEPTAIDALLSAFYGGDSRLGTRIHALLAFHVWYEGYLAVSRPVAPASNVTVTVVEAAPQIGDTASPR